MPNPRFWTSEQDAELTEKWADLSKSSSQIASEMGFNSRNSIIGRANRLRLPPRNPRGGNSYLRDAPRNSDQLKATSRKRGITGGIALKPPGQMQLKPQSRAELTGSIHIEATAPALSMPQANIADSDIPAAQRRTIFSLTNETCRWPIGDPGIPGFFFCGHASADVHGGQPYCATHANRAFSGQGGRV